MPLQVHAANAQQGVVEVVAVEHAVLKVIAQLGVAEDLWGLSRRYSPATTRKPPLPAAGSHLTSFGVGAVISPSAG